MSERPLDQLIRREVSDRIMTIRFDRPDRLNAFTIPMLQELGRAFDEADADDEVRAVVLTGEGRGFCAGSDLAAGGDAFVAEEVGGRAPRDEGGVLALRIFRCLKPVIAAVNGPAVGIGATMTLPMDVRLASEEARFGFVFAQRGIVPEAASTWFLPRVVGISRAMEWVASGRVFDAREAHAAGLVRDVVPADELLPRAYEVAATFTRSAPVSVALSRQMLWRMLGASHPMDAHRAESLGLFHRGRSADAREGVTSFLEKRDPDFTDRVSADLPDVFPDRLDPEY